MIQATQLAHRRVAVRVGAAGDRDRRGQLGVGERGEQRTSRPARTNERMIAGPESPIASPMITKMPVPMIAPMPERGQVEQADGALEGARSSVSATSCVDRLGGEEACARVPDAMRGLPFADGRHHHRAARALHELERRRRRAAVRATRPRRRSRRRRSGRRRAPRRRAGSRARPCRARTVGGRLDAVLADPRGDRLGALARLSGVLLSAAAGRAPRCRRRRR